VSGLLFWFLKIFVAFSAFSNALFEQNYGEIKRSVAARYREKRRQSTEHV
jgi:hypothetical protein